MQHEQGAAAYDAGYAAARDELRKLLRKVPEEQMIGVVAAWLHEGEDDGSS